MPNIKDRRSENPPARSGLGRELKDMRENGKATAAELREFLQSVKGRSPQEVLGAIANSQLFICILIATAGFAVVLVLGSVIPYQFNDDTASSKKKPPTKSAAGKADVAPKPNAEKKPTTDVAATSPKPTEGVESLPKKLGIDETKTAAPNKNPLDSKNIDNLLDLKD